MNNKKVSIIVPIYNGESTLNYCLESISNQTYKNFEVIMVDDGSTDSTKEICTKYSKKDDRFKYVFKENGGVASARNLALKKISGEYISFIDCDDSIEKNYLELSISQLELYKCDISIVKFNITDDITKVNTCTKDTSSIILDANEFLCNLVNGKNVASGCINKIYRKELIENIEFPSVAVGEDLYFNYEIVKNNRKIKAIYSSSELYNYYVAHLKSVMHGNFSKKNLDILKQYDLLLKDSSEEFPEFNEALKKSYVFIAIKLIMKMVASECYEKDIYEKCLAVIIKYKKKVFYSKEYSIYKKSFLLFFYIFKNQITKSYNKKNIFKKICIYMNQRVG